MSWYARFVAFNREDAKAEITKRQREASPHFPGWVAEAVRNVVDALPEMPVTVETSGHIDKDRGNAKIELSTIESPSVSKG